MKKNIFFAAFWMVILTLPAFAQTAKSGILKKDNYSVFTGDEWEAILLGQSKKIFEEKANLTWDKYMDQVKDFVKETLDEESVQTAMDNSKVVTLPEGTKVTTSRVDGSWLTRDAYPGEKGFRHTKTGLFWHSFECGNLCKTKVTAGGGADPASGKPIDLKGLGTATASADGNVKVDLKIDLTGNQSQVTPQGQSLNEAMSNYDIIHAKVRQGVAEANADALMQLTLAKATGCCGQQQNGSTGNIFLTAAQTNPVPVQNSTQTIDVRNKPTWVDYANFGLGLYNAYENLDDRFGWTGNRYQQPFFPIQPISGGSASQGGTIPLGLTTGGSASQGATFGWQ